jgi:orotate phosphoribosyltransferase-like protein
MARRLGERHHRARHSNDVVERARTLKDGGLGYKRIGRQLGISEWTVRDWCAFRTRGHA